MKPTFLPCWFILFGGIICFSLATKLRKQVTRTASHEDLKRSSVCSCNNVGGQWINEAQGHFIYECTGRNTISFISSEYIQSERDRRWKMACGYNRAVKECAWTAYQNAWDKPLNFECPHYGFITGIESHFRRANYDRQFRFKCCNDSKRYITIGCITSAYINFWKHPFNLQVPRKQGYYLVGMYSEHENKFQDRRWKVKYCRLRYHPH